MRVDALAQSGNWCAALELAEQHKNLYLGWLHYGCSELVPDSPNYAQMQELLQPSPTGKDGEKAIIYWHISPAAITTFILRYQQPPVVLSGKVNLTLLDCADQPLSIALNARRSPQPPLKRRAKSEPIPLLESEAKSDSISLLESEAKSNSIPLLDNERQNESIPPFLTGALVKRVRGDREGLNSHYSPSLRQLIEFEEWIETWKKDYQNYRQGARQRNEETRQDTQETSTSSSEQERWREEMPQRLKKLAEILNIEGILQHLEGVNQLILIPHRNLHLLPLDALFSDKFTITRLPSIKVGLDRKKAKQNAVPRQPTVSLLSVDNPLSDLRYASLESELVSKLYPNAKSLCKSQATLTAVKEALSKGVDVFQFTGHGEHYLEQPAQSALILADRLRLTLRDILELDLSGCNLVCLSACETNLTSKFGLIDEFVGLGSCFLAAGVMNVVGSFWNVNDLSTAYLMTKFHEILTNPNHLEPPDVAIALKKAQNLLRNVTKKELQQWQEQLPLELSQYRNLRIPVKKTDVEMKDDEKPFNSPFYWAAFCAMGL